MTSLSTLWNKWYPTFIKSESRKKISIFYKIRTYIWLYFLQWASFLPGHSFSPWPAFYHCSDRRHSQLPPSHSSCPTLPLLWADVWNYFVKLSAKSFTLQVTKQEPHFPALRYFHRITSTFRSPLSAFFIVLIKTICQVLHLINPYLPLSLCFQVAANGLNAQPLQHSSLFSFLVSKHTWNANSCRSFLNQQNQCVKKERTQSSRKYDNDLKIYLSH